MDVITKGEIKYDLQHCCNLFLIQNWNILIMTLCIVFTFVKNYLYFMAL